MRIIAFITHSADIRHILDHIRAGQSHPASPRRAGHRCGMTVVMRRWMTGRKPSQQSWDLAAQPAPDFEVDQRISW